MTSQRKNNRKPGPWVNRDDQTLTQMIPESAAKPGNRKVRYLIESVFAIIFFCYLLMALLAEVIPQENFSFFRGNARQLTEGFVIKDTGEEITIPRNNDPRYQKGITIVGTVPEHVTDEDYLLVYLAHQDCKVTIGDRVAYNFDYSLEQKSNKSIFSTQATYSAMVHLLGEDAGKPLEISYVGEYPEYASNVGTIMVGTYGEIIGSLIQNAGISIFIAVFALALGLLVMITGIILAMRKKQAALFHLGSFIICISFWILCDSVLRQTYIKDLSIGFYITMSSLSICCTPILLFINEMEENRYHKLFYGMAAVNLGIAVLLFLLQVSGTVNYMYTLTIMQVEIGLTVLAVIVTVVHVKRKHYHTYLGRAFLAGIVILVVTAGIEIARMWSSLNNGRGAVIGLGLFCFLISMAYTAIRSLALQMKRQQDEVIRSKEQTEEMGIQLVTTLVNAVDAKDPYTNGHSNRVAIYAREIAKRDGRSEEYQNRIFYMGIVHDIGKIGIPDSILQKPGRLTDEEFGVIKTHPAQGADILSDTTEMPWIMIGARWHHERYDGKGYPDRLAGTDIPEEARIIAVADAYDAMTSDRSYRSGMAQKKVRSIIEEGKGTQWDPHFADIMIDMIDHDYDYKMRGSTGSDILGVVSLSLLLDTGFNEKGPITTDDNSFRQIYQFLKKYARRNNKDVQLVLLTMQKKGEKKPSYIGNVSGVLAEVIKGTIRQSDIMSQLNETQFMIILTDTTKENANLALNRINTRFSQVEENYKLIYEIQDIIS